MTVKEMCIVYHKCESTIHDIIADLRQRYDIVQKYSDKLPVRKSSKKEIYMDNN